MATLRRSRRLGRCIATVLIPAMRRVAGLATVISCVAAAPTTRPGLQYDHGGIVRCDTAQKRLSIVFTAGDFGEGVPHILEVCRKNNLRTAFFVTGAYLRANEADAKRIVAEGHIL